MALRVGDYLVARDGSFYLVKLLELGGFRTLEVHPRADEAILRARLHASEDGARVWLRSLTDQYELL